MYIRVLYTCMLVHMAHIQSPALHRLGVMAHACNVRAKAQATQPARGQSGMHETPASKMIQGKVIIPTSIS